MTQSPSDWTDGYFDELYLELFGFPDAEQTDREISALRTLLPDPPARVLDAACGVGRHAVRLASAGYEVVGLDSSELFLDRANAAAEDAGVAIELVHGDIREIPFGSDFDAGASGFGRAGDVYISFKRCERDIRRHEFRNGQYQCRRSRVIASTGGKQYGGQL